MEYEKWAQTLKTTKDNEYWDNILKYSNEIIQDLEYMKAYKVAEKLNLTPVILSTIKPLLLAHTKQNKAKECKNAY